MSTENYGSIKILSHARNVPEKATTFCWNIFDDPRADLIMFDHFYFTQFFITRPMILKKIEDPRKKYGIKYGQRILFHEKNTHP